MSADNSRSGKSGKSIFQSQAVVITLITVIGSIITGLIAISPQLFSNSRRSESTSVLVQSTETLSVPPTATNTAILPTETATLTETPGPTDTPAPTATATPLTPPISCLDRWQVVSSNPDLTATSSSGDCQVASIADLGISASRNGISFGTTGFKEQGTFGIATEIPADATITLKAELTVLTQGEFWIALSNEPNPETNMLILALASQSGEMRVYNNQLNVFSERYTWNELANGTILGNSRPYVYNIEFKTSGNSVDTTVHVLPFQTKTVNLPKYLFLGYSNKSTLGSMSLQVNISELNFEDK